jgi:hypothetical protein
MIILEIQGLQETIENVDHFIYLGSNITWDNNCTEEIKRRIGMATSAYKDLKTVWEDKGVNVGVKLQLVKACVFSVLLYAADTWTIKKEDHKRLLAFEMRCYRRMLKVKWQDHRSNEDIRQELGQETTIMDIIKARKLQLFGHICRMDDSRLLKLITLGMVEGTRSRGRPPKRWIDDVITWTGIWTFIVRQ